LTTDLIKAFLDYKEADIFLIFENQKDTNEKLILIMAVLPTIASGQPKPKPSNTDHLTRSSIWLRTIECRKRETLYLKPILRDALKTAWRNWNYEAFKRHHYLRIHSKNNCKKDAACKNFLRSLLKDGNNFTG
jgi:hypothetical protein